MKRTGIQRTWSPIEDIAVGSLAHGSTKGTHPLRRNGVNMNTKGRVFSLTRFAVVGVLAVSVFAIAPAHGATAKAPWKIGVSNTLVGNGWREEMICAVKAQSKASGKVSKVIVANRNGGPTEQIADLKSLISQGVNAIIVNPSDRVKLNPVIEQAVKKGIVVVAVDQAVTAKGAYVAANDQVAYGRVGAQWLAKKINGKGNVLYMRGIDGVPADADRDKGFTEVMKGFPDIKFKTVFSGWDFAKGGQIATEEIAANSYDGIWTSGIDYTVVNAFDSTKKTPVPVVGADTNEFLNQLIKGKPGAAVTNPAVIGGVGTAIAIDVLSGKKVKQTTLLTPEVWDMQSTPDKVKANYFPERDATFSAAVSVKPYTTYTPEDLFACKGPGEK
jgi:ribose transport system substrate-binding protein